MLAKAWPRRWRTLVAIHGVLFLGIAGLGAQLITEELALIKNLQQVPLPLELGDPATVALSGVEGPKGIAEGDFRGDGSANDLAVANLDGTVTLLLGKGHTFEPPRHLKTGAQSLRGVIPMDVDADGDADILTAAPFDGKVFLFENLGGGAFAEASVLEEASVKGVRNLATGDFDGDGVPDLAVAGPGFGVRHLRGRGDGSFERKVDLFRLSPVGVEFPKPVYALEPVRAAGGRDDLAVVHAESDEIFVLSTLGVEIEREPGPGPISEQALPAHTGETPILITEFMASNSKTYLDRSGRPEDWIEVYNRSTEAVDLRNWSLSDSNPGQRWRFPARVLGPGEYLMVIASGRGGVVDGEIHTNFSLASNDDNDEEALYLFEGEEERQRIPSDPGEDFYPEQVADISYGLAVNGGEQFFQIPSPGRLNNSGVDSLGDISLTEIIDFEVTPGAEQTRVRVLFSDISRLSLVWLATDLSATTRYWSMRALDREQSSVYEISIPAKLYDASKPPQIVARRQDGRIRPITLALGAGEEPPDDALRVVATLAARSAHTMDVGPLLSPVDDFAAVPDLVLANRDTGHIEIRRGTLQPHRFERTAVELFQVEGAPRAVRIADVNGDGFNDVLVALRNTDKLVVLLNRETEDGGRTFVTDEHLENVVGRSPREIAVVDANGDGKDDAMVINRISSDLSVLLTAPDHVTFGKFDHLYEVDGQVAALTLVDFNGDRRDDVVLTHRGTGDFSIRLAQEDGSLGTPEFHASAEEPNDTEFEDCNDDGEDDAVSAELNGQGTITVRLRDKNVKGGYGPPQRYHSAEPVNEFDVTALTSVSTADFNQDGFIDISACYFDCRHTFFQGRGDGTFLEKPVHFLADEPPDTVPGDFDGDGDEDFATVSFSGDIVVVENIDGEIMDYNAVQFSAARFVFPAADDSFLGARSIRKVRLNGDPYDDLVVGTGRGVRVLLGAATIPGMQEKNVLEEEEITAMAAGDFDGNGSEDVAVVCRNRSCVAFLSVEQGELKHQLTIDVPGARFLAAGDLDGDGKTDLVGVGDVLWTALSSRPPRPVEEVKRFESREKVNGVVINEILARNNDIPIGIDFDKQADYVEIYNSTGEEVSLRGWSLVLDDGRKTYRFPHDRQLDPGKHLLLICSNEERTALHTGFRLRGDGGQIELIMPDGVVSDTLTYGQQFENIALSRYRDGLPSFIFNPLPTPNLPNRDGGVVEPELTFSGFDTVSLRSRGIPLKFTAEAADDVGIVSVFVTYRRVDLPGSRQKRFVLFDDGMHDDGQLFDGVYANVFPEDLPDGAEIQFYLEAIDLTGASITVPSDPSLADEGRNVLSLGFGQSVPLVINEIVRDNDVDVDGVVPGVDYVEIYNRSGSPVSLDGVSLAQDYFTRPDKPLFDFPLGTVLGPWETILVYAGGLSVVEGLYHGPFAIDEEGAQLLLLGTAPQGTRTIIDSVTFPSLDGDVAYARLGDVWQVTSPTPNAVESPRSWQGFAFDAQGRRVTAATLETGAGVRYRVQVQGGGADWRDTDQIIEGTGDPVTVHLPPGTEGDLRLDRIPPEPPLLGQLSLVGATRTSVQLRGEVVDTGGEPPNLSLFMGTQDGGASTGGWPQGAEIDLGGWSASVVHTVEGLDPGASYFARLRARNAGGEVWTEALEMETIGSSLPLLGDLEFTEIFTSGGKFLGKIADDGRSAATLDLFWGTVDGEMVEGAWSFSAEGIRVQEGFEVNLDGLAEGTAYIARARATNADGEVWSVPMTFTTMTMREALEQFLVVSEFMYHPPPVTAAEAARGFTADDFEWIELYNRGPIALDLREVSLQNAVDFEFFYDADFTELQPGAFAVVVANRAAFALRHEGVLPVAGEWCGPFNCKNLSNDGWRKASNTPDEISIVYRQASPILGIVYRDDGGWPRAADGHGASLELVGEDRFSEPLSWRASEYIGGTPGAFQPVEGPELDDLRESLRLTTIAPNDGNEDFLEFSNIGDVPLDLSVVRIDVGITFDFSSADIQILEPRRSLFVVKDRVAFEERYHVGSHVAGEFEFGLKGSGEQLVISAHGFRLIDINYNTVGEDGWPRASVLRLDNFGPLADPVDGRNWVEAIHPVAVVNYSVSGGIFEASFSLELSHVEAGGMIEYTLDPSVKSGWTPYDGTPILIDRTTSVTAHLIRNEGDQVGPDLTEVYVRDEVPASSFDRLVVDVFGHALSPGDGSPAAVVVSAQEQNRLGFRAALSQTESPSAGAQPGYLVEALHPDGTARELPLFDMPRGTQWLLSPSSPDDRSLVRNAYFYALSNAVGRWAPRTRMVEVYLNQGEDGIVDAEDYMGVYTLTETPIRHVERLDLQPLRVAANAEPEITGGYLFREDTGEVGGWTVSGGGKDWEILEPLAVEQDLRQHQALWLTEYLDRFSQAAGDPHPTRGYPAFIKSAGWVDYHWINFLALNVEALGTNTYYHKDYLGKLVPGPVWDFRQSSGSSDSRTVRPDVWRGLGAGPGNDFFHGGAAIPVWWPTLFQDLDFRQAWFDRWEELRGSAFSDTALAQHADLLHLGSSVWERHAGRWPAFASGDSQSQEVEKLVQWLQERARWLDSQWLPTPTASPRMEQGYPGLVEVRLESPRGEIYYTLDGSDPRGSGGSPTARAVRYTGQFPLTESANLVARTRDLSFPTAPDAVAQEWSAPVKGRYYVNAEPADASNLFLSEIMYHPSDLSDVDEIAGFVDEDQFEFIEFYNGSRNRIDLTGVTLTGTGVNLTFGTGVTMNPGEHAVVVSDLKAFRRRYGREINVMGEFQGTLDNRRDELVISNFFGKMITTLAYDSDPWREADGSGLSMEVYRFSNPPAAGDWRSSVRDGGTPGSPNSVAPEETNDRYVDWREQHFSQAQLSDPGVSSDGADPDGDGLVNLAEYALGGDPFTRTAGLQPAFVHHSLIAAIDVTFAYPRPPSDVEITLEVSPDLRIWEAATSFVEQTATEETITTDLPGAMRYVRLRMELKR